MGGASLVPEPPGIRGFRRSTVVRRHQSRPPGRGARGPSASAARRGRNRRPRPGAAGLDVDVRVEAEAVGGPAAATASGIDQLEVGDDQVEGGGVGAGLARDSVTSWPAAVSGASTLLASIRSVTSARTRATIVAQIERRRRYSARTLSGRPHICATSARPSLRSRTISSPSIPWRSSICRTQATVSGAARVAEAVGDVDPPVPVGLRVGLGVDLGHRDRGVDVAASRR